MEKLTRVRFLFGYPAAWRVHVFCMPFVSHSAAINILSCEQVITGCADNVQMKRERERERVKETHGVGYQPAMV